MDNDLLLRAARGEETERVPVWMMRQAGRILPEYREMRKKVKGFKELVHHPEMAAEVTLQPVRRFGVDGAIIFSDILEIAEAMGLPYDLIEQQGPSFNNPVRTHEDVERLEVAEADTSLRHVSQAIKLVKEELNESIPLIGFAGAPWTIFAYMTEGAGTKTFSIARRLLYTNPQLAHTLMDKITQSTINYLKAQINSGANIVQVFDSWAGLLPPYHYSEFGIRYLRKICEAVREVPVIIFSKGAFYALEELRDLPCEVVGLDWNMDITASRNIFKHEKTLQGNLDPCALYAPREDLVRYTQNMLEAFGGYRHIANLGHGVYPDMDYNQVKCFVDTVKNYTFDQKFRS